VDCGDTAFIITHIISPYTTGNYRFVYESIHIFFFSDRHHGLFENASRLHRPKPQIAKIKGQVTQQTFDFAIIQASKCLF